MKNFTVHTNGQGIKYIEVVLFFSLITKSNNSTLYRYNNGNNKVMGNSFSILTSVLTNIEYHNAFNHAKVLSEKFPEEFELNYQEMNFDVTASDLTIEKFYKFLIYLISPWNKHHEKRG